MAVTGVWIGWLGFYGFAGFLVGTWWVFFFFFGFSVLGGFCWAKGSGGHVGGDEMANYQ